MAKASQRRADLIYGVITAGISAILFIHTFSSRYDNEFLFGDVSTVFFPRFLLGLIFLLSVGMAIQGFLSKSEETLPEVQVGRVVATVAAACAGVAGVWIFGYLIFMPIAVFLMGLALGYPNKIILAAVSITAPYLVWLVLAKFAQVSFPLGIFI